MAGGIAEAEQIGGYFACVDWDCRLGGPPVREPWSLASTFTMGMGALLAEAREPAVALFGVSVGRRIH